MIKIIEQYSDSVKDKLLKSMLIQRASVSDHIKEISLKITEIEKMVAGVNIVEQKLQQIIDNEQAYLHKQMQ